MTSTISVSCKTDLNKRGSHTCCFYLWYTDTCVMYKHPKDPTVRVSFISVYKIISLFLARFYSVHTGWIHDSCENQNITEVFSRFHQWQNQLASRVLSIIEANRAWRMCKLFWQIIHWVAKKQIAKFHCFFFNRNRRTNHFRTNRAWHTGEWNRP